MKLTKTKLAELIKQQCDLEFAVDKIVKMMFKSFVSDDTHFNLTYKGYHLLKFAKFQSYKIRMNKPITIKSFLNLNRNCPAPYYIPQKRKYLVLFAEKPAVMLQLLDGDLENFQL
jgi:hypothetical protein|tara:strand:- start:4682 stop:5026 length:345 start_codon:yes stop_codon:yes gene_type:complete